MTTLARMAPGASGLGRGAVWSLLVHGLLGAFVFWRTTQPDPIRPPVYRVELVGQAGPRQVGVEKPEAPATEAPAAAAAERAVKEEKALPAPSPRKAVAASPKATPSPRTTKTAGKAGAPSSTVKAAAPKSGAGATGTKGADVANVRTAGIAFPFPGYLSNIVRQIALNWHARRVSAALVTEVKFLIRRDGSVTAIEVLKSSGDRLYDADAMGAVEAVGSARGFGPLPAGWSDEVLVVYFTFDYALRPN